MYEYIDHVLSNYLSANVGHSEEEAVSILRKNLNNSTELFNGLKSDLQKAFIAKNFLWKITFSEHNVFFTDNETEAVLYARKMLWSPFFES